jgi:glycerol-3-phosphate acyltransferase PlsY
MQWALVAGLFAILGHNYPIWLKFKGGKGGATGLGVLLAVAWPVALLCAVTWLFIAIVSRYSSLATITTAISAPIYAYFVATEYHALLIGIMAASVLIRHKSNIERLLKGEESKIKL